MLRYTEVPAALRHRRNVDPLAGMDDERVVRTLLHARPQVATLAGEHRRKPRDVVVARAVDAKMPHPRRHEHQFLEGAVRAKRGKVHEAELARRDQKH